MSDTHELGFLRTYVFSTDHKVIGIQYGITALVFLFFGLCLMMMMRWQMAYPGEAIPIIGGLLGETLVDKGAMLPTFYNSLGAMHGTIMVFMGIVPLAVGAFGNYVVPLQIGAPDMAFPRLNMMSYQAFVIGGLVMLSSFFLPGGAASSGWTSYAPLAVTATTGQTFWLIGMVFLIASSLLGAINFIVTIIHLRAEGLTFFRLPFFVWSQLVTAFLLLLAFPPLQVAALFQLMDRLAGTSFFLPSGLMAGGEQIAAAWSAGNASSSRNAVTSCDHTKNGRRKNVMPSARRCRIVTMKLIAPNSEDAIRKIIPNNQKVWPVVAMSARGAYEVQPELAAPPGRKKLASITRPPMTKAW